MADYPLAPNQPIEVDTSFQEADLFVRTMTVPDAGTVIPQHSHAYAHLTLLSRGRIKVWKDDAYLGEFSADVAPVGIRIEARTMHRFETLTPGVVLSCIHALHGQPEPGIHDFNGLDFVDAAPGCPAKCPGCHAAGGVC